MGPNVTVSNASGLVMAVEDGSISRIICEDGHYLLSETLNITRDLYIGASATGAVVLDAQKQFRVLGITAGSVQLVGLNMTGGASRNGALQNFRRRGPGSSSRVYYALHLPALEVRPHPHGHARSAAPNAQQDFRTVWVILLAPHPSGHRLHTESTQSAGDGGKFPRIPPCEKCPGILLAEFAIAGWRRCLHWGIQPCQV